MNTPTQYANSNDTLCPGCNSPHVNSTGALEYAAEEIIKDVYCEDCGATWQEIYTITGYRCFKPAPPPDTIVGINLHGENVYLTADGLRYFYTNITNRANGTDRKRSATIPAADLDPNNAAMRMVLRSYFTTEELA